MRITLQSGHSGDCFLTTPFREAIVTDNKITADVKTIKKKNGDIEDLFENI